jgi:hypothetical protein
MNDPDRRLLLELFGDYRAEWLKKDLFGSLFIRPPYFDKLESAGPCLLFGGRGTGKTTALRSLRFDATHVRVGQSGRLPYLGIYIRINKNRVRAFQGAARPVDEWRKTFAHYFNLLSTAELVRLYQWLAANENWPVPDPEALRRVGTTCGLTATADLASFSRSLQDALASLEFFVNNDVTGTSPPLSMAEAPVVEMIKLLSNTGRLQDRPVFCCIDEYENLLDYQQATLNTYVKHSEPPLSYKIGARRNGLRTRQTTDSQDLLVTPDDYREIDISAEAFEDFAREVVARRLARAREQGATVSGDIDQLLPGLTRHEEAQLLGAEDVADRVLEDVRLLCSPDAYAWAKKQPVEDLIVLAYCAEGMSREAFPELALKALSEPDSWKARVNNYGYPAIFWLSKGRKGARIRKYYAGVDAFLALASGNIRYFLELIDASFNVADTGSPRPDAGFVVSARDQTTAARLVAKRRLDQLEGLGEQGFALKRLVLGIGKVFFEMARDPVGKTPEVTSFVLGGGTRAQAELELLLKEGVAQLAFEVTPRTKATTEVEMKDDEYRLHPIFCPFFEFSYRHKRRITFKAELLLALARPGGKEGPSQVISKLLEGRVQEDPDALPEQLGMFSAFYSGGAEHA